MSRSAPIAAFAIAALFGCNAAAQVPSPEDQLPNWALKKWLAVAKIEGLRISTRVDPFARRGDFDGDGRSDVALLVARRSTGKEGIAILLRRDGPPIVVGAGKPFGNGGDDFSWLDFWRVGDRDALRRGGYAPSVRLKADGLVVAKESSASALVYLHRGRPIWQQQGD
ncbi:MAG: hypothetical protein KJZ83_03560 [Burkholderiaceae bacterium]|nr:hypothetical protein [Burkholderiaceae bacterium]